MKKYKGLKLRVWRRAKRTRRRVRGIDGRPRLCVFRSNRFIYAQIIDDDAETTLLSSSSKVLLKAGGLAL